MSNKKVQYCSLCQNHKEVSLKRGHKCHYRECLCPLCKLTKDSQNFMRHQQKIWRHQKDKFKNYKECPELKVDDHLVDDNGHLKGQVCDKCRNHNHLTRKKDHNCPYIKCDCQLCILTLKRRKLMRRQQRLRRLNATNKNAYESFSDGWDEDSLDGPSDKEGDAAYFKNMSLMPSPVESKKKKYFFDSYEGMFGGLGSTSSNSEPGPSEETLIPADFYHSRSMSSPPPLIPIDDSDSDHADDEAASTFEAGRYYVQSPKLLNELDMEELNSSFQFQRQNSNYSNDPNYTSAISTARNDEFMPASLAQQGNPMPNLIRLDDYFFAKAHEMRTQFL